MLNRSTISDTGMESASAGPKFHAPARAGDIVRVGLSSRVENPRRIRHAFEIRDDPTDRLLASGSVRVGCVESSAFKPRDLSEEVVRLFDALPALTERQAAGGVEIPWT